MFMRLPFNIILEILSYKIHIFKVICCLHLEYRIQFEHWWFISSILNKSAFDRYGKQGCTPWFEFCCANILVFLNCKSSYFSDWRKRQGKKQLEREDEGSDCNCFDYFDWRCQIVEVREEMCLLLFGSIHLDNYLKMNFKIFLDGNISVGVKHVNTKHLGLFCVPIASLCHKRNTFTEVKMRSAGNLPSCKSAVHIAFNNQQ